MAEWHDEIRIDDVEVVKETDKALFIRIERDGHWIPKSQVSDNSEVYKLGDVGTIIVSPWWARQYGFE